MVLDSTAAWAGKAYSMSCVRRKKKKKHTTGLWRLLFILSKIKCWIQYLILHFHSVYTASCSSVSPSLDRKFRKMDCNRSAKCKNQRLRQHQAVHQVFNWAFIFVHILERTSCDIQYLLCWRCSLLKYTHTALTVQSEDILLLCRYLSKTLSLTNML